MRWLLLIALAGCNSGMEAEDDIALLPCKAGTVNGSACASPGELCQDVAGDVFQCQTSGWQCNATSGCHDLGVPIYEDMKESD